MNRLHDKASPDMFTWMHFKEAFNWILPELDDYHEMEDFGYRLRAVAPSVPEHVFILWTLWLLENTDSIFVDELDRVCRWPKKKKIIKRKYHHTGAPVSESFFRPDTELHPWDQCCSPIPTAQGIVFSGTSTADRSARDWMNRFQGQLRWSPFR